MKKLTQILCISGIALILLAGVCTLLGWPPPPAPTVILVAGVVLAGVGLRLKRRKPPA